MKRDGLVTVVRSNRDKRFVNIILTDKGREALGEVMPVATEVVKQIMLSISEDDAVRLEKLLRFLRKNAYDGLEYITKSI